MENIYKDLHSNQKIFIYEMLKRGINVSIIERTTFQELYLIVLGLVLLPILAITLIIVVLKKKKATNKVKKEDRRKI